MPKKKKKRSLAQEFDWYEKKDGTYTLRHRLAKISKEMGKFDKECKASSINDLEYRLYRLRKERLSYYPTYSEYLIARTRIKICWDWLRYKVIYEAPILSPYTIEDGTLVTRHHDGTPKFSYAELSEDESRIIIRDSEGNIIDTIYGEE